MRLHVRKVSRCPMIRFSSGIKTTRGLPARAAGFRVSFSAANDSKPPFAPRDEKQPRPPEMDYKSIAHGPPIRTFLDGSKYWAIELTSVRIGLGHFDPGWVWSKHAGTETGMESQSHIGIIQSGKMAVKSADGSEIEIGPGDAFEVGPGHNAWVVGDETCVALDVSFKGSDLLPAGSGRDQPSR